MTALSPSSNFTGSSVTEGDQKAWIDALALYLINLFGADGTVATALATLGTLCSSYVSMAAAGVLSLASRGALIDATGTWALGLPAISSLPPGWSVLLRNSGTGVITLTPPDGAVIDGLSALGVGPGRLVIVQFTGSAWITMQTTVAPATTSQDGLMAAADKAALDALGVAAITALRALTPAADQMPYFSGSAAAALTSLTALGRTLAGAVDAAAARTALGMAGTPLVSDLTALREIGFKQPARYVATANINLATGGLVTVDGLTPLAGERVLCVAQTNPAENGIYNAGTGAWTRATDADATAELAAAIVPVERGPNGGSRWVTTWKKGNVLGTAAISWFRLFDLSLVLPAANGGTGQASLPLSLGALKGYATTATAGLTTTLTAASPETQVFTGTLAQIVVVPTASAVVPGTGYLIVNKSTGALTIKASDGSTITTVLGGQTIRVICNATSGGTSAAWTVTVPAGGVIERTASYTRYADGRLVCTTTLAASSSGGVTWTFPYAFVAAPVITGTAIATVLSAVCLDAAPSATVMTFSARDKTDARRADTCHLRAEGRWF